MSEIKILEISKLLECNFFIPSYQRGYRWTEQQVKELLNDINEFTPKEIANSNEKTWYCLQPIVVKQKSKNEWDVIDGQQRLTTIYLILHYLNQRYTEEGRTSLFELEYETRKGSANYLKTELGKTESDDSNIDYFHISKAYQAIKNWFRENKVEKSFEPKFYDSTKVIWYEISKNEDSIGIFTRINSGKIPLTNAELIKALFLNSSNFIDADKVKLGLIQREIASEWDRIEYTLQDDSFWYFINKSGNKLATRIEFIFNLMADKTDYDYSTFRFFNEKFKTKSEKEIEKKEEEINVNWQEIKKYFLTLEEWYNDRELYHKIGFLIAIGTDIKTIVKEKEGRCKSEFSYYINEQIYNKIKDVNIDNLEYGNTNNVRNILLLHNVLAMLKNENETSRFPFDRFKKENWDVEHIHAIATNIKVKKENQIEWLKNNFIKTENHQNDELNKTIDFIKLGNNIDENEFEKIIEYVVGEEDNNLQNLCLLDRCTNRSYKNDAFKQKRKKIIERELDGTFIPICTKNIFMKYYSENVKDIEIWNENDKSAYKENIKVTINNFFNSINISNNEQ